MLRNTGGVFRLEMPKATPAASKRFEELTPTGSNVTSKKMFGQPAAFLGGNLFFGVFGGDLFVRLSEEDASQALKNPGFKPFEPMAGRPMRGYVVLPPTVLSDAKQARSWISRSMSFVGSLPPKKAKSKVA
ncbi:MAG: TfoX/Sxy family protein [Thermoplasmata archaeon]|nr:TfoX/Sxy family protein [Thermoplasmata archaeon]